MTGVLLFAAGFISFPLAALAIVGPWAWRHIRDAGRW